MMNSKPRLLLHVFIFFTGSLFPVYPAWSAAAENLNLMLSGNIDTEVISYPGKDKHLILWVAPDFGFREAHHKTARALSAIGIPVWMVDITDTLFLTRGSRSMRQLNGSYVAELIKLAHERSGKKIVLMSSFYGAIPVLRGARLWQTSVSDQVYLTGAVLFSPALYTTIPQLGKDPDYLPIVDATNIPVMIFQGEANGMRWQIGKLLDKLHAAGSPAYATLMPGITSLFYPEEPKPPVQHYLETLPGKISHAINLLDQSPVASAPVSIEKSRKLVDKSPDIELQAYRGDITPSPLRLHDVDGKAIELNDYRGKVTVVNFWATWCPPCVEEIPSLNRLVKIIDHPDFRMISVNFAEDPETVQEFLKTFSVRFPILLDRDGTVSRDWKVIVFPSTYVIGPDGRIRYGVNAAIDWDSEKTISSITGLLPAR